MIKLTSFLESHPKIYKSLKIMAIITIFSPLLKNINIFNFADRYIDQTTISTVIINNSDESKLPLKGTPAIMYIDDNRELTFHKILSSMEYSINNWEPKTPISPLFVNIGKLLDRACEESQYDEIICKYPEYAFNYLWRSSTEKPINENGLSENIRVYTLNYSNEGTQLNCHLDVNLINRNTTKPVCEHYDIGVVVSKNGLPTDTINRLYDNRIKALTPVPTIPALLKKVLIEK